MVLNLPLQTECTPNPAIAMQDSRVRSTAVSRTRSIVVDASGHTLVETLVAMSLFVGALIPLLAAIGNLLFDDRTGRLQEALLLAQAEIVLVETSKEPPAERTETAGSLTVKRHLSWQGSLLQIDVVIRDERKGGRTVLHLSKSIVAESSEQAG